MSHEISRRHFVSTAATTVAAAQIGKPMKLQIP
jgi:hypothetical protein